MADIKDIAVAAWRLEKWLETVNVERKMAAKSSLRSIKRYLSDNNIEVMDLTGTRFDVGLAVSVVNNESEETDESKLIISEMVRPIIKQDGAVIEHGQVILGETVKKPKENRVIQPTAPKEAKKAEPTPPPPPPQPEPAPVTAQPVTPAATQNPVAPKPALWPARLQIALVIITLLTLLVAGYGVFLRKQPVPADNSGSEALNAQIAELQSELEASRNDLGTVEDRLKEVTDRLAELSDRQDAPEENTPAPDAEEGKVSFRTYMVQRGDTLLEICRSQGIDFYPNRQLIMQLNGLQDSNLLQVGQVLLLPES